MTEFHNILDSFWSTYEQIPTFDSEEAYTLLLPSPVHLICPVRKDQSFFIEKSRLHHFPEFHSFVHVTPGYPIILSIPPALVRQRVILVDLFLLF